MSRPPYPHKCKGGPADGTDLYAWTCRCGARPDIYSAETARDGWGANCPIALRERIAEQDRHIASLDCRFAGHVAELSGKHCPPGQPCDRCEAEARAERAEAERDEMRRELADLRTLGASIHKAVAAALEARAKEIEEAADQRDADGDLADKDIAEAMRLAARIVRGA